MFTTMSPTNEDHNSKKADQIHLSDFYRVLIPSELSLVVTRRPLPPLDRLVPLEECIKVCSSHKKIVTGTKYNPFSGTVRADKLPLLPYLPAFDSRTRYGGYDSSDANSRRTCNWVRFLKVTHVYNDDVNIVGFRFGPNYDVIFEVIRDIPIGGELIAYLIPDSAAQEESLLVPALQFLRNSFYRKAIDDMIADAPLDLSRSLLTAPKWGDNSSRSPSPVSRRNQSSDVDEASSDTSAPPSPISVTSISPPPHSAGFITPPSSLLNFGAFNFSNLSRPSLISPSELRFPGILPPRLSNIPTPPSSVTHSPKTPMRMSPIHHHNSQPTKRRERTMLPCSECGKAFDRPSLLKRHMRTHTGEKPHVCDVCSRAFSTSSSLNTHRRIHSGEKPHSCPVCGKRFTASSNLYYHKMTHIKEKPHKCSLCTRSFPTPGDLRSHMFVHNGQWPHKCTVCGKGFSKLTNLRNHTFHHTATKAKL